MISEPELVGDEGEIPPQADLVATPERARRPLGSRPPWLWALGGALLASAVWAGSLALIRADSGVDLKGYKVPEDLCTTAELSSLSGRYGERVPEHRAVRKDPALDRAWCSVLLGPPAPNGEGSGFTRYAVELSVEVHKESDPEPEFKALSTQSGWWDDSEVRYEEVDGLGDRAYYLPDHFGYPQLRVLDGPVVLDMTVSHRWEQTEDEDPGNPPEPEFTEVRELMTADLKRLMRDLKK
ncbi:hypothetical protein [Streptomyces indicus]|uniref:Uncharacterized protein n=1 Tax=Streptomyces indicus TaxID=417292 RepID=A0A1G9BGH0_9ACTN|nr:hypothetical protein [Streptomyces indicus]SDK38563.1 hypothetical protein SAMN05421806_10745 [Streptomyces indicus]